LYRVVFSNRGAVVKSWELKKYMDDSKPQKVLNVVHPEAAQATGGWPFALIFSDPQLQAAANDGLYVAAQARPRAGRSLAAAIRNVHIATDSSRSRSAFTSTIRMWCMSRRSRR
jgi:hypothetical protein